tara:strand:- start:1551 stop:2363 length:813 start_codon:yes stop_codon:yes gene_type:complete
MKYKDTSQKPVHTVETGFTDSENSKVDDIKNILNIPMENVAEKVEETTFDNSDPFGGSQPVDDFDELGLDDILGEDGEGVESLFEDTEALAEMCVELLDLGMNYASQAISTEWGEDEKYAIPDSRKRKLKAPLAKLLQKRAPKVSPELAFMVFAVAIYSPQLIKAYQVRKKKLEAEDTVYVNKPTSSPPPSPMTPPVEVDEADEYEDMLKAMHKESVVSKPIEVSSIKEKVEYEKPKRKAGRPKGSKDKAKRKAKVIPSVKKGKKSKGKN